MDIIPQIKQLRETKELQEYAQAQYNTILQLTKSKKKLEEEIKHLQELLSKGVPQLGTASPIQQGNDQELICKMELQKLREISTMRELTLEECRKVETYSKILTQYLPKKSEEERQVEELKTEDLLQLVKDEPK